MTPPKKAPPLQDLVVVELGEFMAGPYCGAILGDMGADVIKIERPGNGDPIRQWGCDPRNPFFLYVNRNKRSLTLDYKSARGKDVFLRLIERADILIDNFRPTVLERAGLGDEVIWGRNPRLIHCSLSGFGGDGPYRDRGGFDLIAQAVGGLMHVNGEPDGPVTSMGQPVCDLGSAMWAVGGILAAVHQRQGTGRGQRVECSLLETAVAYSAWSGASFISDGVEPQRLGARHRQVAPYQRFRAQDGYLVIGCGAQRLWERFCRALEHPEWIGDSRYLTIGSRLTHRVDLEKDIEAVLVGRPVAHWTALLDQAGIPCGPINNYRQVFDDPQVRHRQMVVHCHDDELGDVPHLRTPVRLSEGEVSVRRTAPRLGEHTAAVLGDLGFSPEEIAALRAERVV